MVFLSGSDDICMNSIWKYVYCIYKSLKESSLTRSNLGISKGFFISAKEDQQKK